jgi:hypothetical protein
MDEFPKEITAKAFQIYLQTGILNVNRKGKLVYNDNKDMQKIADKKITIGKRADLNNQFFRSSWEANYARYLNMLINQNIIIKWEYEPDEFEFVKIKRGNRYYKPDFKVFYSDGSYEYHEVKGYYDKTSLTKLKRFRKYFPHLSLIMIDEQWFKANNNLKQIIKNWE